MDLSGNKIFITGGTSGIGLALAQKFLELDNIVIVCGRNLKKINEVKKKYPKIHVLRCDISDEKQVLSTFKTIKEKFGNINILVNNAGVQEKDSFLRDKNIIKSAQSQIKINFESPVRLSKIFLEMLIKNPNSAIINISSAVAYEPIPSIPIYCATKSALNSFSRSLRYQLKNSRIKVFCVFPPRVDTKINKIIGTDKGISPEKAAKKIICGLKRNRYDIRIGQSKLLYFAVRFFPYISKKIMQSY